MNISKILILFLYIYLFGLCLLDIWNSYCNLEAIRTEKQNISKCSQIFLISARNNYTTIKLIQCNSTIYDGSCLANLFIFSFVYEKLNHLHRLQHVTFCGSASTDRYVRYWYLRKHLPRATINYKVLLF